MAETTGRWERQTENPSGEGEEKGQPRGEQYRRRVLALTSPARRQLACRAWRKYGIVTGFVVTCHS